MLYAYSFLVLEITMQNFMDKHDSRVTPSYMIIPKIMMTKHALDVSLFSRSLLLLLLCQSYSGQSY